MGYVVACLYAPWGVAVMFADEMFAEPGQLKSISILFTGLSLIPFGLVICLAPAVVMRSMLATYKPYQLWKFAVSGALVGSVVGLLFVFENVIVLAVLVLNGAICGMFWFQVEQWARKWRLAWMIEKQATNPGWQGTLSEELKRAQQKGFVD
ncbi:hypothetical protein ACMU_09875 [Actibacterium mucosum KCTC 23349]|uniref:Uncharacterized protein n=1 Tax=Actibacterium mucosum KCTC 23349 TaxID=1454373 RepID=A0A037ZKH5_9RHOB|nr:hypothetical protein [Actibacterium mucosum]KAJ56057.1 hypothetical protein ACMU_09875 [Actibacterium mucosum KCTC 23349]